MGKNLSSKPAFNTKSTRAYMLAGWRTHSAILLTGVPPLINDAGNHDVVIRIVPGYSPIGKTAGRFVFRHSTESSLIRIKDVADFEIIGGRQIRVWKAAGAKEKDIEIFLFGPAWATLCYQRGVLPLHASAIVTANGITAFAGHSGAGKSTTAALLNSSGYELIADDILPISFNQDSIPGAWPYLRRLKLRRDLITQLAVAPTEVVSETFDKEKYFVLPKSIDVDKWRRLERLYLLENDITTSQVSIEQITGADAVRVLVDQTYHFKFIIDTRQFGGHLAFCTQLASKIPIYRLRRSLLGDEGTKFGSLICAHLERVGG
jgi:hypothetical protein